ncbi:sodium:calcium antiporter [Candidatus Woesearchaeota archaeon]|nr:sodium:calcium antiporter [Candidatus Woesearchaeota archaeon]
MKNIHAALRKTRQACRTINPYTPIINQKFFLCHMYQEVIVFLVGCIVLVKSSDYAVRSIAHIARSLRMTEFVTSFIMVALVSALPETFISIIAAIKGDPSIGIGTLLGSNIADLTLILGLVALAGHPLTVHSSIIKKDMYFVGLTTLPIILGLDGTLGRIDAAILLISGITFMIVLLSEREYFHKSYKDGNHFIKNTLIFILSAALMLAAATAIVTSSHTLAINIGIPAMIIGLVLIALGTTLPEFTFSLQSIRKGHSSLAIGDLLGVVVVDATIITGITALIQPVTLNLFLLSIVGVFTAIAAVFALMFMRTDETINKNEAITLILFYIAFVVVQVFLA